MKTLIWRPAWLIDNDSDKTVTRCITTCRSADIFPAATHVPMAASNSSDIVYLEDIQLSMIEKKTSDDDTSPLSSQKSARTVSKKRQLTFEDMFTTSKQSQPSNKKLKLNSIPFSLVEYKQSLSLEQAQLLNLECEVMGKSW